MLIGPGQNTLSEFRHLLAVPQHDGVLADQVDAADVAVEVDADAGPVEPRRHLLDVGGFAGAVVALDEHAAVVGKAREDRQRRVVVEAVGVVHRRHVLARLAEGGHLQFAVDAESLAYRDLDVGGARHVINALNRGLHVKSVLFGNWLVALIVGDRQAPRIRCRSFYVLGFSMPCNLPRDAGEDARLKSPWKSAAHRTPGADSGRRPCRCYEPAGVPGRARECSARRPR